MTRRIGRTRKIVQQGYDGPPRVSPARGAHTTRYAETVRQDRDAEAARLEREAPDHADEIVAHRDAVDAAVENLGRR